MRGIVNKASVEGLFPVQDVDARLMELQKVKDHLFESSGAKDLSARVVALKSAIDEKNRELRRLHKDRDELETKSSALMAKVKNMKAQELSGSISHRDIFTTEAAISSLESQRSSIEDEELQVLADIDEAEAVAAQLKTELGSLELELEKLSSQNENRIAELSGELESLRVSREKMATAVDPKLMAIYDTIRNRVSTSPVARIENSVCQGCRLKMSSVEVQDVKTQLSAEFSRPPTCEQCGRILYI